MSLFFFVVSIVIIWKGSGLVAAIGYVMFVLSLIAMIVSISKEFAEQEKKDTTDEKFALLGQAGKSADQRPCPVCAETIQKAAKKCIHCGEFIAPWNET